MSNAVIDFTSQFIFCEPLKSDELKQCPFYLHLRFFRELHKSGSMASGQQLRKS